MESTLKFIQSTESKSKLKFKYVRINIHFFINKFQFFGSPLVCISNEEEIEGYQPRAIHILFSEETWFKLVECNTNGLYTFSFSEKKAQME